MATIKTHQVNAFLAKPDRAVRAFLLFGNDVGLINERAKLVASRLAEMEVPAGEIVRLDENQLESDPERLAVEILTVPMFGGAKIVRTVASRRVSAPILKPLLDGPPLPGALIVEAGALRPDDSLRALFEKSSQAVAIGCYADDATTLETLISDVLGKAGLQIRPEARRELVDRLGADRALSRGEVEKLALYAADAGTIDVGHVEAVVGDASEMTIDTIINAAAAGDAADALRECDRAVSAGESPQTVILAVQRHFQKLHRTRAAIENGRSIDDVIRQLRPPLHFRQKAQFERQCRSWTARDLAGALSTIAQVAKVARFTSLLETPLLEHLLLDIARMSRKAPAKRSAN